jgi:hypothetical protein
MNHFFPANLIFFLFVIIYSSDSLLYSKEKEQVSIRTFVKNDKGKITESKNFKKTKSLTIDGRKVQLSHILVSLNDFTGSSYEDFTIKVYDSDTVYLLKRFGLAQGSSESIFMSFRIKDGIQKTFTIELSEFEEFKGMITILNPFDELAAVNLPSNVIESLTIGYSTGFNYSRSRPSGLFGEEPSDTVYVQHNQSSSYPTIEGNINDIKLIISKDGKEVYRNGPFCINGTMEVIVPYQVENEEEQKNTFSGKKDYVNIVVEQYGKKIYDGHTYLTIPEIPK